MGLLSPSLSSQLITRYSFARSFIIHLLEFCWSARNSHIVAIGIMRLQGDGGQCPPYKGDGRRYALSRN